MNDKRWRPYSEDSSGTTVEIVPDPEARERLEAVYQRELAKNVEPKEVVPHRGEETLLEKYNVPDQRAVNRQRDIYLERFREHVRHAREEGARVPEVLPRKSLEELLEEWGNLRNGYKVAQRKGDQEKMLFFAQRLQRVRKLIGARVAQRDEQAMARLEELQRELHRVRMELRRLDGEMREDSEE